MDTLFALPQVFLMLEPFLFPLPCPSGLDGQRVGGLCQRAMANREMIRVKPQY